MSTISVTCPSCLKRLKVPAEKAGKRVKCPGCQSPVLVPTDETASTWKPERQQTNQAEPPPPYPEESETVELTPMQWVTVSGAVVLVLSLAFLFVRPDGQLWRVVGLVGITTIAVPHHQEIWSRVKSGAVRLTKRRQLANTNPTTMTESYPSQPAHPSPIVINQMPERRQQVIIHESQARGGCLAAFLTLFIPGLGHMASGRVGAGILWFLVCTIGGFILLFPTLGLGPIMLYLVCILDAASGGGSSQRTTVVVS